MTVHSVQAAQFQYSNAAISFALAIAYEEYQSFNPDANGDITVNAQKYSQQNWQNKRLTDLLVHPHPVPAVVESK